MSFEWSDLNPLKPFMSEPAGGAEVNEALKKGKPYNYVGADPYKKNYDELIAMLTGRANGEQSLAQEQYKQAHDNTLRTQLMMGAGRSPGAARQASMNMAYQGQGLGQGLAQAGIQERNTAMQGLGSAIGQASQADFMRQHANQLAYLQALQARLGTPTGMDKMLQLGMGLTGMAARG